MTSLEKDVSKALDIDVLDKSAASATDASATETPAIEPPVTPTTPEMPIPETFTEADAHAAASQPLAIVQEAQAQPAADDAESDVLKDAKAS
jgi:sec-independent protein translocase protein TatB